MEQQNESKSVKPGESSDNPGGLADSATVQEKPQTIKEDSQKTDSSPASQVEEIENCIDGECGECPSCIEFEEWELSLKTQRTKTKIENFVVDKKTAVTDFYRFCDAQRIDADESKFDEKSQENFDEHKDRIINSIRLGKMEVNEKNELLFHYSKDETRKPVLFKKPKGVILMAMDRCKAGEDTKGMFELLSDMTKQQGGKVFTAMDYVDSKTCQAVALLFLGS